MKMKRHRLTAKEPENNYDTLMNYAYVKEDMLVHLRYAGEEHDIALHEYAAKACKEKGCDIEADYILEESLIDCPDCPIAIMYYLGCQAGASNRVLMEYEDAEEKNEVKA